MLELNERQKLILALVIRAHIETTQPIGSVHLVERYHLDFSSATVRNEMVRQAEADEIEGVADGVGGAGAAVGNDMARPFQVEGKRELAGKGADGGA